LGPKGPRLPTALVPMRGWLGANATQSPVTLAGDYEALEGRTKDNGIQIKTCRARKPTGIYPLDARKAYCGTVLV
jgi:hypothetical protein